MTARISPPRPGVGRRAAEVQMEEGDTCVLLRPGGAGLRWTGLRQSGSLAFVYHTPGLRPGLLSCRPPGALREGENTSRLPQGFRSVNDCHSERSEESAVRLALLRAQQIPRRRAPRNDIIQFRLTHYHHHKQLDATMLPGYFS